MMLNTIINQTSFPATLLHWNLHVEYSSFKKIKIKLNFFLSSGASLCWRVDASIQDTTSKRQIEAIQNLGKLQDPDSPTELIMRAIIVGSRSAPKLAEQPPLWAMEVRLQQGHTCVFV